MCRAAPSSSPSCSLLGKAKDHERNRAEPAVLANASHLIDSPWSFSSAVAPSNSLGFQTLSVRRVCFRMATGAAKVVDPASQPARRTASIPRSRLQRSGWLPCATKAAMAADCGLITGLSYGCHRCSSCEQPGSRYVRPPPRRAPAERAGASRGLTGAPHDRQKVRVGLSNPPYCPISCPICPVLCPSDSSHSRIFALAGRLARTQAGLTDGDAGTGARARRRARRAAAAARRVALGAPRARFARLRAGADSTAVWSARRKLLNYLV